MKTRKREVVLPVDEWDFRLCPEKERAACLHYEYAREYVQTRPDFIKKLKRESRPSPYDHPLKFIRSDKAHPDSLPLLCPSFPVTPWLGLPPQTRIMLIAQCQLLPEKDAANFNLLVEDEFDVAFLQELDESRKLLFKKWMQDNRDQNDRLAVSLNKGKYVSEEPIERPRLCNGPKRYYAISEHTAVAVIRLDWTKSKNELHAAFKRLLDRGPKDFLAAKKKPQKGGRGGASDQLNALGAKRLHAYYGSPEDAVEAVERVCFEGRV